MTKKEALDIMEELRSIHRYWVPNAVERRFLDDLDFDLRYGSVKEVSEAAGDKLRFIYASVQEYLK